MKLVTQLTERQEKALAFIRTTAIDEGVPPTLRELCDFMGYNAIGSAQDVVATLRRKGYLQDDETQKARSLRVTNKGKDYGREGVNDLLDHDDSTLAIPCLGRIPAGKPVEAIGERTGILRLSRSMFPRRNPDLMYALQAEGLSMINAGIHDGDWLIVEAIEDGEKGDIVVAAIDDDATVKRLAWDRLGWHLMPENPDFKPIYAKDRPFKVVGRVIGLQRSLV